ncbi:hypothetical protein [Streptomyces sp. NPDC088350]|uniref:hypothetical protein n=1 Tax=Streptomyces sp. NPDC088350 TaxID=3365854 RepID=UPI0038073DBB
MLGYPVGATGAILSLRVAQDLVRRDLELGVVTMGVGGEGRTWPCTSDGCEESGVRL